MKEGRNTRKKKCVTGGYCRVSNCQTAKNALMNKVVRWSHVGSAVKK